MRKFDFQNDRYYHIYNRGVDKRYIYCDRYDYLRFIRNMRAFNAIASKDTECPVRHLVSDRLVDIICYSLQPNHFHFLIKQISNNGISVYMHKLMMGYTKYFNKKNTRSGSLFQGAFKAVKIITDEQLLHVSAYIHGNSEIHRISNAEGWLWSSYSDYLNIRNGTISNKNVILNEFTSISHYKKYVDRVIVEAKEIKKEKRY